MSHRPLIRPGSVPPAPDYSGLVILVVLGAVEVGILYVLIAVDTPFSPTVRRMVLSPLGVLALALFGVGVICAGMWGFTSWAEWMHKKQNGTDRVV